MRLILIIYSMFSVIALASEDSLGADIGKYLSKLNNIEFVSLLVSSEQTSKIQLLYSKDVQDSKNIFHKDYVKLTKSFLKNKYSRKQMHAIRTIAKPLKNEEQKIFFRLLFNSLFSDPEYNLKRLNILGDQLEHKNKLQSNQ